MVRRARPGSHHAQFGYTGAEISTQGADFLPGDLQVTFQACKNYKRWQKYLPEKQQGDFKFTGLENDNDNWQQTHYHCILYQTLRGPPW